MASYLILPALIFAVLLSGCCAGHRAEISNKAEQIYNRSAFAGPPPPHPFKSDGCSCWPDGDWMECCIQHDLAYWRGGTREERKDADLRLSKCVSEKGHPFIGRVMYPGVRMGGVWWLPTPFRWGFGWDYPDSGPPGTAY